MKLKFYSFSQRERTLLALLVVVVVISLAYLLVWDYQWPAYQQRIQQTETTRHQLEQARASVNALPEVTTRAEQASRDWQQFLLEKGLTIQEMADFITAAQPHDQAVKVVTFRPGPAVTSGQFTVIPCSINVFGPYPAVVEYIKQLEALPALLAIHNLKLASRNDGLVETSFILDFYKLQD
jgi:Tfp pilus assembly protein PilO